MISRITPENICGFRICSSFADSLVDKSLITSSLYSFHQLRRSEILDCELLLETFVKVPKMHSAWSLKGAK
ncbi:hypothetical protein KFK09_022851 [Dendrobium nobile]|uniref:Uncharacterized protein n=1 Tax=Dendrobium nobile TaxID=94219 RepID=A0A8T3AKN4_DENNO|nr:hypothetical protein KFK09_022851 [Dendrobium nobile]